MAYNPKDKRSNNFIDETGNIYGRLRIIELAKMERHSGANWLCQCSCGNVVIRIGSNLRGGNCNSCGCLRREVMAKYSKEVFHKGKDRRSHHPLFKTWKNMIRRCYDIKCDRYEDYGGRGITICDEWHFDFWAFVRDIGKKPTYRHSIDRINNDGNYEKSNVKWSTPEEQYKNTRVYNAKN